VFFFFFFKTKTDDTGFNNTGVQKKQVTQDFRS